MRPIVRPPARLLGASSRTGPPGHAFSANAPVRTCHDAAHGEGAPDLSRPRIAVAAAFLMRGLVLLSLTTRLPEFQDRWAITDVQLSLILLMMILLAGAGSVARGDRGQAPGQRPDAPHRPGDRGGGRAGAVHGADLRLLRRRHRRLRVRLGMVDACSNMQAVALEHRYQRPILPSFHGAWTLGGVVGAAITLATTDLPLEAGAALGVLPLLVAFGPFLARDHGPFRHEGGGPWRPILLVGLAMVLFYMIDTAVQTWGPLFLDHTFDTPERYVALAALCYLLASGTVRLAGDWLVGRFGPVRCCGSAP